MTAATATTRQPTPAEIPAAVVSPPASDRYGWYEAGRLAVLFGGRGKASRNRRLRWIAGLPGDHKRKVGGRWLVRGDVLLSNGETLMRFCQRGPAVTVSAEIHRASERQRRKQTAASELVRKCDRPHVSAALAEQATADGLGCARSTLYRYGARLAKGELIDKRAGSSGRRPTPVDDRVRAAYDEIGLHPNFDSFAEAWRHARDAAEELGVPIPSAGTMKRDFGRRYPKAAVAYSKNERRFEADNLPKIRRDYTDIEPLEWISLDGRVLDVMCRAPAARNGWRRVRPVLTGVLDIRTRMFVGWDIRECETSDGILAGLKMMHRDFGCARHYYADNGEAYKVSVGARLRNPKQLFDDPRIGGLCAQTGAERHNALPYGPCAKIIESHWLFVKNRFDRYCWSFWGGSPDERPDGRDRETMLRLDQLPTLAEIRRAFGTFLERHHAEPQSGSGMFGLSPNLAMEQFRGEIRRIEPDVLDFLCCRLVGPRKVTRDGFVWNNVRYGHFDEQVWKLQGRKVWLRIDPDQADFVWVCDERGAPMCKATNRKITGATQEQVREAARIRGRMRKIAKQYAPARDFLLGTSVQQITQTKARHAKRREEDVRKQLPKPAEPTVTLVRPDLVEPLKRVKQTEQRSAARAAASASRRGSEARSNADENPFETLAKRADLDRAVEGDPLDDVNRGELFAEVYGGDVVPVVDEWEAAG